MHSEEPTNTVDSLKTFAEDNTLAFIYTPQTQEGAGWFGGGVMGVWSPRRCLACLLILG